MSDIKKRISEMSDNDKNILIYEFYDMIDIENHALTCLYRHGEVIAYRNSYMYDLVKKIKSGYAGKANENERYVLFFVDEDGEEHIKAILTDNNLNDEFFMSNLIPNLNEKDSYSHTDLVNYHQTIHVNHETSYIIKVAQSY